ncbi:hypothetical protein A2U01_0112178, partial [Trifolium medium]|nr:hypothetical protein [Trifolium medium]
MRRRISESSWRCLLQGSLQRPCGEGFLKAPG